MAGFRTGTCSQKIGALRDTRSALMSEEQEWQMLALRKDFPFFLMLTGLL